MVPEQQLIQQIVQLINSNLLEKNAMLQDYSEQFADICRLANERLRRCDDYLGKGMRSEAVYEAHTSPDLLELADALSAPELKKWQNICLELGLTTCQPLDGAVVKRLRDECSLEAKLAPLLKDYRRAVYQSDHLECIRVLRELCAADPGNPAWRKNLEPLEEEMLPAWLTQAEAALAKLDIVNLKTIYRELNHPNRVVKVPDEMMVRLRRALMTERTEELLKEGRRLLDKMRQAMSREDADEVVALREKCEALLKEEAFLIHPDEWDATLKDASELLEALGRRQAKQSDFNKEVSALVDLIESDHVDERAIRHAWEHVESWNFPVPEAVRRQVEGVLAAKKAERLKKHRLGVLLSAGGIVAALVALAAVIFLHNRSQRRSRLFEEMQMMLEQKQIASLINSLDQLKTSDPSFYRSPNVKTLEQKAHEDQETIGRMQQQFAVIHEQLETIRRDGYHEDLEQIERLLKEAQEQAVSGSDRSWIASWRKGWQDWQGRQAAVGDTEMERVIRRIRTSLQTKRKPVGSPSERKQLEELKQSWEDARSYEPFVKKELKLEFAEMKELLDERLAELDRLEEEQRAAEADAAERRRQNAETLQRLRREIPRSLPNLEQYERLLSEFVAVGAEEKDCVEYRAVLAQMDAYRKAALLNQFSLPELASHDAENAIRRLLAQDAGADNSVWKRDLTVALKRIEQSAALRKNVAGLLNTQEGTQKIYVLQYRKKDESTWKKLYAPEPILHRTVNGVTQYWGSIFWSDSDTDRPTIVHSSKLFPDKLTSDVYEIRQNARPDDNLAPHIRFLRKLVAESNEAAAMDVLLLKSLQEIRGSEDMDRIPGAWLAKRIVYFLYEQCLDELPECAAWKTAVDEIQTDVPWLNPQHPDSKATEENVTQLWMRLPDFSPFIRRLEIQRAWLTAMLNAGVGCVGTLQRNNDGDWSVKSCAPAREWWLLQPGNIENAPEFILLSRDAKRLEKDALNENLHVGQPVFAPQRGHETSVFVQEVLSGSGVSEEECAPSSWPRQ